MTAMPKAIGLFETHLTVSDLDRSIEFYRDVVGLPLALVLEERRERLHGRSLLTPTTSVSTYPRPSRTSEDATRPVAPTAACS